MNIPAIIAKKRNGESLSREELTSVIQGYLDGTVPDYQVSALLMAICFQGMSEQETFDLTELMVESGDQLDLSSIAGVKVDKHSTGGVGDKTTLVVLPLAASCGVKIAKLSGRGLGHTGGTIDKLESISGFRCDLSEAAFMQQAQTLGLVLAGQTGDLVPADKKLYALRDVTATVDSIPLIAASVMSKKLASGADAIVLDVKCGSGAFMKTKEEAVELAKLLVKIGRNHGRPTSAFVTSMDRPLGRAVGNAIEVNEAIATLSGEGTTEFTEFCIELAAEMLRVSENISTEEAIQRVRLALSEGHALKMFNSWVKTQGSEQDFTDGEGIQLAHQYVDFYAEKDGFLNFRDVEAVGLASMQLGAGRMSLDEAIDYGAGIFFYSLAGQLVQKGQAIARLFSSDMTRFEAAEVLLRKGIEIVADEPQLDDLILDRILAER